MTERKPGKRETQGSTKRRDPRREQQGAGTRSQISGLPAGSRRRERRVPESGLRRSRPDAERAGRPVLGLTHVEASGASRMVDVAAKPVTARHAVAEAKVSMNHTAAQALRQNRVAKGNVLEVARLAGIQAAKRTGELIPLCHNLPLDHVQVDISARGRTARIRASASALARTGVEMEAMVAASVAALAVYDMLKALDKGIVIGPVVLLEKSGGKSGTYRRPRSERDVG